MRYWIGIDIGGTQIKGALVDEQGLILETGRCDTPVSEGREAILHAAAGLARAINPERLPIQGVGVGSAGRIDSKTGTVLFATRNLPGWTQTPIKQRLEADLGYPVYVDNDVNAAARGEAWLGAARSAHSFVFLALGTGVGGAYFTQGAVIQGYRGGAAELGHMVLYPDGVPCNCGQYGCVEQYVSGTALSRAAGEAVPSWNSYSLFEAYRQGDRRAVRVVDRFTDQLALVLVSVQHAYDPEYIVLGGGIGETYEVWRDSLTTQLSRRIAMRDVHKVVSAELGNRSGILGAVRGAMQDQGL